MEKEKLSFIPKQSVGVGGDSAYDYKKAGLGFALKGSIFLFILSFILFGGALLYKNIINEQIGQLSESLDRAQAAFDIAVILEIEKVSENIANARTLIGKHPFPSNILKVVEGLTHEEVGFQSFSFLYDPEREDNGSQTGLAGKEEDSNTFKVTLNGEAKDYVSLAQQSKILEESEDVADFSFLNFSLTQEGHVAFLLEVSFDLPFLFKNLQLNI